MIGPCRKALIGFIKAAARDDNKHVAARFHVHHALLFGSMDGDSVSEDGVASLLASVGYALTWYDSGGEGKGRRFTSREERAKYRKSILMFDGLDVSISLADATMAIQNQRAQVMRWIKTTTEGGSGGGGQAALDRLLCKVAGVVLHRGRINEKNWEPAYTHAHSCMVSGEGEQREWM